MKIIIDIGHPAHVHLFKNFAIEMQKKGHVILFTCREKEFEIRLLQAAGFKYISLGHHYKSVGGKAFGLLKFNLKLLNIARKFQPDVFLSSGSMYAAQVSALLGRPHIALEDTENMEQIWLYKPFSKLILTPDAIPQKYGKKQLRYKGFHQSAFLHPNYFKREVDFKRKLGISSNERVFLLRMVALNATHDLKVPGLSKDQVLKLINILENKGRLFISSEKPLVNGLEKYSLNIAPEMIHDFISICDLVIGESSTMSNEAGYLGVPNIFIEDINLNVLNRYSELGLKIHFKGLDDERLKEVEFIVSNIAEYKEKFERNSKDFINNSIDLTAYLVDLFESKNFIKNV